MKHETQKKKKTEIRFNRRDYSLAHVDPKTDQIVPPLSSIEKRESRTSIDRIIGKLSERTEFETVSFWVHEPLINLHF